MYFFTFFFFLLSFVNLCIWLVVWVLYFNWLLGGIWIKFLVNEFFFNLFGGCFVWYCWECFVLIYFWMLYRVLGLEVFVFWCWIWWNLWFVSYILGSVFNVVGYFGWVGIFFVWVNLLCLIDYIMFWGVVGDCNFLFCMVCSASFGVCWCGLGCLF